MGKVELDIGIDPELLAQAKEHNRHIEKRGLLSDHFRKW